MTNGGTHRLETQRVSSHARTQHHVLRAASIAALTAMSFGAGAAGKGGGTTVDVVVPPPSFTAGEEAQYLVWPAPIVVPKLASVAPQFSLARESCRAASVACQHAQASCHAGGPLCGEPGHDCADQPTACNLTRVLCAPLRDGEACPGFARADDPGLRFLASTGARSLLRIGPGAQELRFRSVQPGPPATHITYQHFVSIPRDSGPLLVPVRGSYVTLHLGRADSGVLAVSSHLARDFNPSLDLNVSAQDAIEIGVEAFRFAGYEPASVPSPLELEMSAERISGPDGSRDVIGYHFTLSTGDADESEPGSVLIDAATGDVVLLRLPAFGPVFVVATPPPGTLGRFAKHVECVVNEGQGHDRFANDRKFSTSKLYPPSDFPVAPTFGTTSCDELGWRDLRQHDVITCGTGPSGTALTCGNSDQLTSSHVNTSSTNLFGDPSVVESQYWGEQVLRFAKQRGFGLRETPSPYFKGLVPARIILVPNAGNADSAQWTALPTNPPAPFDPLAASNGHIYIQRGKAPRTRSWTDPGVIAHEFFHSVSWDFLEEGGKLTASASGQFLAIREALADCFAMLFLREHMGDLGVFGYAPSPYALFGSVFEDADEAARGYRNLASPREQSVVLPGDNLHRGWAGDKALDIKELRYAHSTLVSGACKLLVTGGYNEDSIYKAVRYVPGEPDQAVTHSLGWGGLSTQGPADEAAAHERLRLLLLELVRARAISPKDGYFELVEALAAQAEYWNVNAGWKQGSHEMAHRVRRAFDAHGWGRGKEGEPNDAGAVRDNFRSASYNLIAVGQAFARPIEGEACCKDQDFFVLDELARGQDSISWSLAGPSDLEVRFYLGQPCEFQADINGTQPKDDCSLQHQIAPVTDGDGHTPPGAVAPSVFQVDASAPGAKYRVYVGLRRLSEGAGGAYTLSVNIKRYTPVY